MQYILNKTNNHGKLSNENEIRGRDRPRLAPQVSLPPKALWAWHNFLELAALTTHHTFVRKYYKIITNKIV